MGRGNWVTYLTNTDITITMGQAVCEHLQIATHLTVLRLVSGVENLWPPTAALCSPPRGAVSSWLSSARRSFLLDLPQ